MGGQKNYLEVVLMNLAGNSHNEKSVKNYVESICGTFAVVHEHILVIRIDVIG